jgi:hypothetical protein
MLHMEPPHHHIYKLHGLGLVCNHKQLCHTRLSQVINLPYNLSGGINCPLSPSDSRHRIHITQSIYMQY